MLTMYELIDVNFNVTITPKKKRWWSVEAYNAAGIRYEWSVEGYLKAPHGVEYITPIIVVRGDGSHPDEDTARHCARRFIEQWFENEHRKITGRTEPVRINGVTLKSLNRVWS